MQTFVQCHCDIRIQLMLDMHRIFGAQEMLDSAIDVRCELDALFGHFDQIRQRHNLKAAAVGQNWPVPTTEFMQPAHFFD